MPIKEFKCTACGHQFEELVWLKEPDPAVCPKCGKGPLSQILGTFKVAGMSKKSARAEDGGGDDLGGDPGAGFDEGGLGGDLGGDMGGDLGGDLGGDPGGDLGGGEFGGDDASGGDLPE